MRVKSFTMFLIIMLLAGTMFVFTGCEKDEFVEVCAIEYTTNGTTKTEKSTWYIYSNPAQQSATKTEFDMADAKYKFTSNPFSAKDITASKKVVDTYNGLTKDDIGSTIYIQSTLWDNYVYYKYEFSGFIHKYIKVKIKDDTTIVIRNAQGDTTYTVSSYRITYFE